MAEDAAVRPVDWNLQRNPFGQWVLTAPDCTRHTDIVAVRAFPLAAPGEGVSLVSAAGREVAWIERLDDLPPSARREIEEALAEREFMPRLLRIRDVSGYGTPSTWQVDTDRGPTRFVLKGEEDIRRLPGKALLIASSQGVQFAVPDFTALDRHSRRLLEHFL